MKPAELAEAKTYASQVRDGFLHGSVGRLTKIILALVAEIELRDRLAEQEAVLAAAKKRKEASELPDVIKGFFKGLGGG